MVYSPQKKILILVTFFAFTLSLSFYYKKQTESYFSTTQENILKDLPDGQVKTLDSSTLINIKELKNKDRGLLIHFWGTWCGPCEVEFPALLKRIETLRYSDIDFVLVAVRDDQIKIKKFIKRFNLDTSLNIKFVLDETGDLMTKFGTFKLPETYIVDKSGQVKSKFVGPQDWENEYYKNQIQRVL